MKKLLKLTEQVCQVRLESLAPVAHARIRDREKAHENVRAADIVPARFAGETNRLVQGGQGRLVEKLHPQRARRKEYVVPGFVWHFHRGSPRSCDAHHRRGSSPSVRGTASISRRP